MLAHGSNHMIFAIAVVANLDFGARTLILERADDVVNTSPAIPA
jgi:hypothetical protein